MRKICAFLVLCFGLGVIHAATMPFAWLDDTRLPVPVSATMAHGHCDEAVPASASPDGKRANQSSGDHACCLVLACSTLASRFVFHRQTDDYRFSEIAKPVSNVTEAIFRPPRARL